MEQSELDKCKNDMAYFAEKYFGVKLLPWQRIYLKLLKQYDRRVPLFSPGRNGKQMLLELRKRHDELFGEDGDKNV